MPVPKPALLYGTNREKKFIEIICLKIHGAIDKGLKYHRQYGDELFVRFEDARLRTWFANKSTEALQGAGSIKRDCSIWEDFLSEHKIHFASIAPRIGITKLPANKFQKITGWAESTNNHARDAAMLIFGY